VHASLRLADAQHQGLVARVLIALVRGYKLFVSPHFHGSCRFVPSCADYAREAVERHGAARGSWLALRRLARCHPLARAGFDPVPTITRTSASHDTELPGSSAVVRVRARSH
jgi:putative membrane protein insertion efficiency factor